MQIGIIGCGKMGANMARRLMTHDHECVVYDSSPEKAALLVWDGAVAASSLEELVGKLSAPKTAWVMLPAGEPTETTIVELSNLLSADSTIIDGGNTHFKDDVRRSRMLKAKGIHYVDVGTSGGVWGVQRGYCLMIGGDAKIVKRLAPIFETLAPGIGDIPCTPGCKERKSTAEQGYLHCGPSGAGHFVKMIHNGIEYGLMQAYAEGFHIMHAANSPRLDEDSRYDLNVADISELWRRGSVVGSWLLDLAATALSEDVMLSSFAGFVGDSGEGRWTIQTALEEGVPAGVISTAVYTRFRSRQPHTFAEKLLSAMREKFGGHAEEPVPGKGRFMVTP
jgi:6-phosphogluconate dehydrogenase